MFYQGVEIELSLSFLDGLGRSYATPENYWDVYFGVTEGCKEALDNAGIEISFPQRDIHFKSGNLS